MKIVIQRVSQAAVTVNDAIVAQKSKIILVKNV